MIEQPISKQNRYLELKWIRYAIALGAVCVAFLIRLSLSKVLGSQAAFITFLPAIMLVSMLGGFRLGVFATVVSATIAGIWLVHHDGPSLMWWTAESVSLILFIAMGVFMSLVAGVYHRTRQKAAEYDKMMALRESEAQYRELVQNANSAIIRWKGDGTITFFNEYAQHFFGYSEEEALGKSVLMLLPETDGNGVGLSQLTEDILNDPNSFATHINENVLRDGTRVWMNWTNKPIYDENGQMVEVLAVGSDITKRKRAEDALKQSEEHKQEFFRRTIFAATEGKLLISELSEIEQAAGPSMASWEIGAGDVTYRVRKIAAEVGMSQARIYEFLGCVTEAAANVIKYARGGVISMHKVEGVIFCLVSDTGPGILTLELPDVALTRGYSTAGTLGMGFKLMIQLADRIYLATGPGGTTVAIEMAIAPNCSPDQEINALQAPAWAKCPGQIHNLASFV